MTNETTPTTPAPGDSVNVEVSDTIGAMILGIALLMLLLAYMRAQGRNRKLAEKLAKLQAG